MSPNASRSPWLTIPIFFGLFFGGGFGGIQVSHALVPDSALAEFISFLALPAAFVIGIVAWAGAAIPGAVRRFIRLLLTRDRASLLKQRDSKVTIPPGSFAFVPAALVTCTLSGVVVAVFSTRLGFGWVLCLHAALGFGYGVACWKLARTGYLPFPSE